VDKQAFFLPQSDSRDFFVFRVPHVTFVPKLQVAVSFVQSAREREKKKKGDVGEEVQVQVGQST
jgi:hypothetical protein